MKNNNYARIQIILFILIALSCMAYSLSFTSPPNIDNETQSDENVLCYWNASVDTTQENVTWYNNSLFHSIVPDDTSPNTFSTGNTRKGETWTCEVTISNGTNILSSNASVVIQNSVPTNFFLYNQSNDANLGNSTILYEDTTYSFYLNASDYDGDSLLYAMIFGPNITLSNGQFTWTPDYDEAGNTSARFIVDDDGPLLPKLDIIFQVVEVNDSPVFSPALQDQNATEGSLFEYIITATDEESDYPLNFTIIDNGSLSNLTIINLSSTQANLSITPNYADAQSPHTITIMVTDTAGKSTNASFILTVISINHAPNITYVQNVSAQQNELFTMQINASDLDANDTLIFNISAVGCPLQNPWTIQTLDNSSNSSLGEINMTLTNSHIVCRHVNITVTDNKTTASYNLTLNITNVNDAPIIYENSVYASNTHNNVNISNLTAYTGVEFRYRVNFTDPDASTYMGENLTITDNESYFGINTSTGEAVFTPNSSVANTTLYILINVTDDEGLADTKVMVIYVINNSIPAISPIIPNMTINESQNLIYDINASDLENDTLTYYIYNSTIPDFSINSATGVINFTPNQTHVGNHTITVRVNDTLGTYDENTFILEVKNVNDPPALGNITFPPPHMVANHTFAYNLTASDQDILLQNTYENLTFWVIWVNSTTNLTNIFNITKINSTTGRIYFTPNASMVGNYTVTFGVNDSMGLSDNVTLNFTVYNTSQNPVIVNITPYGPPPTNFGWANASSFSNSYTAINTSENSNILFNHSSYDPEGENLTYTWSLDGGEVSSSHSYSHYFDYASAGEKNITLRVEDPKYGYDTFSWIINVSDKNRPVVFVSNPSNLTITAQTLYPGGIYMKIDDTDGIFYDPDDDLNSNGELDSGETNNLVFTAVYNSGATGVLDILIEDINVTFIPRSTGVVYYNFTASDGYTNATTGIVRFNVSYTPVTEPEIITVTKTKTKPRYYQIEVDKIINLDIVAPQTVTLYENNTAIIPIKIINTGNSTLYEIKLTAESSNEELEMRFEKDAFDYLPVNSEETTNLIVESYRSQGTYEIEVKASVTSPDFEDTALIVVSSIEKEGSDPSSLATTKTKISYAKDLLSSNPECLELNEMLQDVQDDIARGDLSLARDKLDEIISTCRYLTSTSELTLEKPSVISVNLKRIRNNTSLFYSLISITALAVLGTGFSMYYTNRKQE